MPVEFLSDEQAMAYGRFRGGLIRAELERYFFLDDADRMLVKSKRRKHNKLGFAVQLSTVRYVGRFLDDPLDGCRWSWSSTWPSSWASPTRRV